MEINLLKSYIENNYSLHEISKITKKSLTTVIYWVNKYNLKSNFSNFEKAKKEYGETRFCPRCKKDVDTKNFYQRRGKENSSTYCKSCTIEQTIERTRKFKAKMIEYKGGCCSICGYNKYQGALDFHHICPSEKDFSPSHFRKYTFDERVKNELDKCILVCSNCHREIHDEIVKEKKRD